MTIKKEEFIRKYVQAIRKGNAAVFAGAGLSCPSGFVNWKELLRPLAKDIGLDVDKENDLLSVAQFYRNKRKNRTAVNQAIMDAFSRDVDTNENIDILSRLPIRTYWTTNYDELLECGIKKFNRNPDVKSETDQLSVMKTNRDAVVYKMHGDVNRPANAVLTKSDYEVYENKRPLFRTALKGDLISKTFLFIGFSFEDPNLDYVLGQIHSLLEENCPEHFCFFRRIQKDKYDNPSEYGYDSAKQEMQIENLENYGIQTVLVDSYDEITEVLHIVEHTYKMKNVFISGSASAFDEPWDVNRAEYLAGKLAGTLVHNDYRITSGFGLGIGSAVINGALKVVYSEKYRHTDDYLCLRPFPQNVKDIEERNLLYKKYREDMIDETGVSIFMFGNKYINDSVVEAAGCIQEFKISKEKGNVIIPFGSTGYAAKIIYDEVKKNISEYKYLSEYIDRLGTETDVEAIVKITIKILEKEANK